MQLQWIFAPFLGVYVTIVQLWSPSSSVNNDPTELPTSTESKPGPHKHSLAKQLKNNVHGASPNDLTNYACHSAVVEMDFYNYSL
jgi:hypothetical protein